eukprot:9083203-Pyramimonas_sp.AAC.1
MEAMRRPPADMGHRRLATNDNQLQGEPRGARKNAEEPHRRQRHSGQHGKTPSRRRRIRSTQGI